MPQAADTLALLNDAISRTLANPTASHNWINLVERICEIESVDLLRDVVQAVQVHLPATGLAGYYRALCLAVAASDIAQLAHAAAILPDLEPRDPDRLAAFFHFAWPRALVGSDDRSTFIANLKRAGLPAIARLLACPPSVAAPHTAPGPLRRVAVVAQMLLHPIHPPTRMVLDQVEMLARQGIAVSLFCCQDSMLQDDIHLLGVGPSNPHMQAGLGDWRLANGESVPMYISSARFSLRRRWQELLPLVEQSAPDLVLFVGLHSCLVDALYQRYPVLALATNSVAPLVPSDVWLTAQQELNGAVGDAWSAGMPVSQAFYHPFRARRQADAMAQPMERSAVGIPADAVLMLSMGSHLPQKICGEWASQMSQLMGRLPALHWLLVGGDGSIPPALQPLGAAGRVHALPYSSHAQALLRLSDIYINPPMMGGGMSVSHAMEAGLPVVSLADCDGGDKLGDAAVASVAAFIGQVEQLACHPAARVATGERMRVRFDTALDIEASGPSLLRACELARQRFRVRQSS